MNAIRFSWLIATTCSCMCCHTASATDFLTEIQNLRSGVNGQLSYLDSCNKAISECNRSFVQMVRRLKNGINFSYKDMQGIMSACANKSLNEIRFIQKMSMQELPICQMDQIYLSAKIAVLECDAFQKQVIETLNEYRTEIVNLMGRIYRNIGNIFVIRSIPLQKLSALLSTININIATVNHASSLAEWLHDQINAELRQQSSRSCLFQHKNAQLKTIYEDTGEQEIYNEQSISDTMNDSSVRGPANKIREIKISLKKFRTNNTEPRLRYTENKCQNLIIENNTSMPKDTLQDNTNKNIVLQSKPLKKIKIIYFPNNVSEISDQTKNIRKTQKLKRGASDAQAKRLNKIDDIWGKLMTGILSVQKLGYKGHKITVAQLKKLRKLPDDASRNMKSTSAFTTQSQISSTFHSSRHEKVRTSHLLYVKKFAEHHNF